MALLNRSFQHTASQGAIPLESGLDHCPPPAQHHPVAVDGLVLSDNAVWYPTLLSLSPGAQRDVSIYTYMQKNQTLEETCAFLRQILC